MQTLWIYILLIIIYFFIIFQIFSIQK